MDKQIKQVMAVEKKAEKIVADAHVKAETMVDQSRKKAIDLRSSQEEKLSKNKADKIKAIQSELEKDSAKVAKDTEKQVKDLKAKSSKQMDKTVDYIVGILKDV